jgi:endonuclease YncB( thermonuclease family)
MIRSLLCLVALFATAPAVAEETFHGPVVASVNAVVDGDTLDVTAHVWLGLDVTSRVRIRGIDTPELHSRCAQEKALAEQARTKLIRLVGDSVQLSAVAWDKYGGRVDATVVNGAGADLAAAMIATGLAHPYDGKGERADWCPVASVQK